MEQTKINGSTIYDKVFKLVDYNGEVSKSQTVMGYRFSDKYSPNNIKRLIISPDEVIAIYHTAIQGGSKQSRVVLSSAELKLAENLPDYKPILNILSSDRVCASIEEIIFLSQGRNPNINLSSNELAFENLVRSYKNRASSLEETVASRYKRLRVFTIANMSIDMFNVNMRALANVKTIEFISDAPFMEGASKKYIHKEDWWNSWGSAAQTYPMDAVGGTLHNHFTAIKQAKEKAEKTEKVNKFKEEANKGLATEVKDLYDKYSKLLKVGIRLHKLFVECGSNGIVGASPKPYTPAELYECSVIKNYIRLNKSTSDTDALKKNKEILKVAMNEIVAHYSRIFITALFDLSAEHPIVAKTVTGFSDETTIIIPNDVSSQRDAIAGATGVNYNGTNVLRSMINSCWLYCLFFINRSNDKFSNRVVERDYWEGALK